MIGYGIAYSVSPILSTPLAVGRVFLGGAVAAPCIGLLIGMISRKFAALGQPGRVAIALADLYLASWLFLLATGLARLLGDYSGFAHQIAYRALVVDPAIGALLGLTYTGYVLVLWPLSYANHLVVARAWTVSNAMRG